MISMSVNGLLEPSDSNITITDQYQGHFIKVSYSQEISGNAVFTRDRIDVGETGKFRFFLPPANLIVNELVSLEIYSPNGGLIGKQNYSYGSLNAADINLAADDNSKALKIKLNPYIVTFNEDSPTESAFKKVSGRVIDLSGEDKNAGLQVIIFTSSDSAAEFDTSTFTPVMTATSDKDGYFFGQVVNRTTAKAVGVIAGMESEAIVIPLEDDKIPNNVILVADLSSLDESAGCGCDNTAPSLPDSKDLVNSSSFSQDLGGTCVDFTVPNRTLEEFSFYHTVRTTEPEIRGFTINGNDSQRIKEQLFEASDNAFSMFSRLKSSFSSLTMLPFSIDEDSQYKAPSDGLIRDEVRNDAVAATDNPDLLIRRFSGASSATLASQIPGGVAAAAEYTPPNYVLKLDIGYRQQFNLSSNDIVTTDRRFQYTDIISLILAQSRRQQKLKELHQKLAAAYCGKNGVQEEMSFCEQLAAKGSIDREELQSLLGHVTKTGSLLDFDDLLAQQFRNTVADIDMLINTQNLEAAQVEKVAKSLEKTIISVDKMSPQSAKQETLLGYLRRMAIELANHISNESLGFEPCPIAPVKETMGIMCLMQKYQEIRNTLKNTTIFSLGEIIEIESYYQIFVDSIASFITLLEEYNRFYQSGVTFGIELVDDYFVQNYDEISSTLTQLNAQIRRSQRYVEKLKRAYIQNHPGRVELSVENSIDWDETPTVYENTTIAHGHILHFKQQWKADGYSLGDLLYSLPLAPCQEKRISILDWDRQEQERRDESQDVAESMIADISRDRDITEIMNSSLSESMSARSRNRTSSTSAGIGGGAGGFLKGVLFGVAGGVAHSGATSTTTASQNSSRNLSANSLNSLQDNTSQSASSLRSQRNSVVQSVQQNESVAAQTEVIKNHNHCHAITVEYFEVLKHYAIEQNLVDVQECLFVPMPMSDFDHKKVLRWRNTLENSMYGRKLRKGFGAIERIESNYVNADLPMGSYADVDIEMFSGHFTMTFDLARPYITAIDEATQTEEYDLSEFFPWFFGKMTINIERELTDAEKDALFEEQYAADIVRRFIDRLSIFAVDDQGLETELDVDLTLLSNYTKGTPLKVSIATRETQSITRRQFSHLLVRANTDVKPSSRIILRAMYLGYRTKYSSGYIVRNSRVNNDVINTSVFGITVATDAALIYTPMNQRELLNPRKEDQDAANALIQFLNENLELSHKVIWSSMDASRLFGLLDGYIAPNSGGRSVASVVENKVMGVVGNNLVVKVIPGERLDPVFKSVEDLLNYYQPTTPQDPYRISVPTKGVYAESVMGKCNSCEQIDESRHWRFDEAPCSTSAPEIEPLSTDTRRSEPSDLQVKDLPTNLINMQAAPAAPAPTSLADAYALLGQGDAFRDITGIEGTQANALGALQTTSKQVTDLASISKDFANLALMANQKRDGAKQIEQIKKLNKDGYLSDEDTTEQIKEVLGSYNNAAKNVSKAKESDKESTAKQIAEQAKKGMNSPELEVEYQKTSPDGEVETIKVTKPDESGDAANQPIIILRGDTASAENRAFNPAVNDTSMVIQVSADYANAPDGASIRWASPTAGALIIDNPSAKTTSVRGVIPGLHDLDVALYDNAGNRLASTKLKLSVPQCVLIGEDTAAFDQALSDIKLTGQKTGIVEEMKDVCAHLLGKANVRLYWTISPNADAVPAHVTPANTVSVTIKNRDPDNLGVTVGVAVGDSFNEQIELYPGTYNQPDAIDVDTETQALILELESALPSDTELVAVATTIYGRLIGETLSHEIGHALLWDDLSANRHNDPAIANDLMNRGVDRMFTQRTGMENTVMTSPVEADHYNDSGVTAIGGFQAHNQRLIDDQWPVPPALV
ncbi:hypothetical protein PN836_016365 [Ningiella sp. W23]|uniref:hypothetical protein n=1 Tax=Ningiella sp. W23 TaxID=3023715 RepID=UPI0037579AB2